VKPSGERGADLDAVLIGGREPRPVVIVDVLAEP
jgi:hypothetical protein